MGACHWKVYFQSFVFNLQFSVRVVFLYPTLIFKISSNNFLRNLRSDSGKKLWRDGNCIQIIYYSTFHVNTDRVIVLLLSVGSSIMSCSTSVACIIKINGLNTLFYCSVRNIHEQYWRELQWAQESVWPLLPYLVFWEIPERGYKWWSVCPFFQGIPAVR